MEYGRFDNQQELTTTTLLGGPFIRSKIFRALLEQFKKGWCLKLENETMQNRGCLKLEGLEGDNKISETHWHVIDAHKREPPPRRLWRFTRFHLGNISC